MKDFDAIVIGAGNGGLTAAATLQRGGLKTLLLERHNIPGGCATSFVRGPYEFEVALHQLSGMGTPDKPFILRKLFADLGIMDKVDFVEEPELYRMIIPGIIDITLPASVVGVARTLKQYFPKESRAIDDFLELCKFVTLESIMVLPRARKAVDKEMLRHQGKNFAKYGLKPAQQVFDEFFDDEMIKAVLGAYWGYLGLPLRELSFADMGALFYAYAEFKPYHVIGGSQALSNALLDSFLEAGGEMRFNCAVDKILTESSAVRAVRTEQGDEITCHTIVSNASSLHTYNELLDVSNRVELVREDFKSRRLGVSAFVIYLGLDCTPEQLGVTAATNFIVLTPDDEAVFRRAETLDEPLGCGFTCYNVDDPSFAPEGKSIASLICIQYGDVWKNVAPDDYVNTKYAFAEKLLDLAETVFPNIRSYIEEVEIATPLTMMRYLNTPGGAIYGFDQNRLDSSLFRERYKEIDGLYLAGAWSGMGGFQPTYQAGVSVANSIIRTQIYRDKANV
ncbi:MAG: phytoene dehydrogenase [Alphaproteobacteria bacterium]|nr:MAG: phytoene dehydrogenase [Alphaproteobacteria bacterium]